MIIAAAAVKAATEIYANAKIPEDEIPDRIHHLFNSFSGSPASNEFGIIGKSIALDMYRQMREQTIH